MSAVARHSARRTVAVLLAGGSGTRSGLEYPKQFLRLGGRTVIEHTVAVFGATDVVDEIVVVMNEGWIATATKLLAGAPKVTAIIPGGDTRHASTQAAIRHLTRSCGLADAKVLVHDAVRPLLAVETVEACHRALDTHDAVDVVVEADDTIVEVHDDVITKIPERRHLRRGQTPQAFSLRLLREAYATLDDALLARFTDDCAVVMAAFPEVPVLALPGHKDNMKITHPVDIAIADRLLQMRQSALPVGGGYPARDTVVVIGGSSGIGAATVELLEAQGARVVSLSRRDGGVDVRDAATVAAALADVRASHGPIAAVVNCAGLLAPGDLVELAPETIAAQIDVNLLGSINVARTAHPHLRETGGHLVFFTSSSYTRGRGGYAVYSATKAAIVNLAQGLAEEWQDDAIKVNCINPARTHTPMRTQAFGTEAPESLLSADRVAEAVAAVLSGTAGGHVYDVRLAHAGLPTAPADAVAPVRPVAAA